MTPSKYITVAYKLYAPMEGNEKELIEEAKEKEMSIEETIEYISAYFYEDSSAPAKG